MYHISDIKKFINCPKLFFLSKDENTHYNQYLRNDLSFNEVLKVYFDIDNCFLGQRNDSPEKFIEAIDNYEWFFNVRLQDEEMRIRIPLLHKVDDGFDIYFTLFKINNKEADMLSYRINVEVFEKCGFKVKNAYIIYLNGDYVYHEKLEEKKLLIVDENYKNKALIDVIRQEYFDYQAVIEKMSNDKVDDYQSIKSHNCRLKGSCQFYEDCFKEELDLPDDSILTLVSSQNKNKMYEEGVTFLKDANIELCEGNRVQYAQIQASKNGGLFVEKTALNLWLKSFLGNQISFLDFEWDRYLVPVYEGMKPFDVLCFEFALYYLDENGKLEHRTFIETGDCRKEFIEKLLEYLPEKGPILAYNANGAEVLRIKELAEVFPEYQERLNDVVARFVDLATPFIEGVVYDTRMKGNFTVKKLVSIVSSYSYKDLDVGDGMQAVYSWRDIDKGISKTPDKIIDDLDKYCSLDAYSLFLVYKWLVELAIS